MESNDSGTFPERKTPECTFAGTAGCATLELCPEFRQAHQSEPKMDGSKPSASRERTRLPSAIGVQNGRDN
jgi:hypothetical protein